VERLSGFSQTALFEMAQNQDLPVFCREFNNCFANDLYGFSASQ
jgi:hypothetical protein